MVTHLYVVAAGFVLINGLSIIIARRAKKHIGARRASFVFLLVLLAAAYYLVDTLQFETLFYTRLYFYFWISILVVQSILFIYGRFFAQQCSEETMD